MIKDVCFNNRAARLSGDGISKSAIIIKRETQRGIKRETQRGVEIVRLLFVVDKIPKHERDRVRRDLLDYCHRDALAMVRLVETWKAWPELLHGGVGSG